LNYEHQISASKFGDFMVDNQFTFKIGGPSKGLKHIKGVPQSYLALDIKSGTNKSISLWLFGFLY